MARAQKVHPRLLPRTGSFWRRAVVALSGSLACMLTLFLWSVVVHMGWGVPRQGPPRLTFISPDSPAAKAGLAIEDSIIAIDGHPVATPADVTQRVDASGGRPLPIELRRAGVRQTVMVAARPDGSRYRIGVQLDGSPRFERAGLGESLMEAVRVPGRIAAAYVDALVLATSGSRPRTAILSPVGVVRIARQSGSPPQLYLVGFGSQFFLAGALGLLLSIALLLSARPAPSSQTP